MATEEDLIEGLRKADLDAPQRVAIIAELRGRASSASIPVLRASILSEHVTVRVAALRALAQVGGEDSVDAISSALTCTDYVTVGWAANLLATMQATGAVPLLIERAELREPSLESPGREAVLLALGRLPDPRAVDVLRESLLDARGSVRKAAVSSLCKIGTPESLAALEWAATRLSWFQARVVRRALRQFGKVDEA